MILRHLVLTLALSVVVLGCDKSDAESGSQGPAGPTPAASTSDAAHGKLAGLYIRQRSISLVFNGRITFNLVRDFYYFFPDGHIVFGVPPEGKLKEYPTAADFAEFKGVPPEQRGTYVVKDDKITFTPDKGNASTEPFSIPKAGDDSVLQIGEKSIVGSCKALPFKDGQKLDGSYQFDGTIGLRGPNTIFNVNTLTFRPDGTLAANQLSGIDTSGPAGVTAGGTTQSGGTYKLSGYTLEKTVGGKSDKLTCFRWAGDSETAPGMICISGRIYSRQAAKK